LSAGRFVPALFVALGCSRAEPGDYWLLLGAAPGSGVRLSDTRVTPADALLEKRVEPDRIALRLRANVAIVRVNAPGGCPIVVKAPSAAAGFVERTFGPLFDLGAAVRVAGPEQRFEIRATEECAEAADATLELRVKGGAPLDDVRIEDGGRTLVAKTRGLDLLSMHETWGIVPVSAERRCVTEIAADMRLADGTALERRLEVSALARSSGLPSIAVGHGVLLAGPGFRVESRPDGSRAELRALGGLTELVPDVTGDFVLADELGRKLVIQSGRYDEMPLDCGRSDCHKETSESVRHSPMTSALAADLRGGRRPLENPECALACHTTGEPGTNDGGFSHVRAELGLLALPETFAELPRALRRLGGVGCLACHGPARVPPDSARWSVLRSDVCATCHDAPPRYGHVSAFATTKMSAADRDARTRERPECARCHTAWGYLGEPARRPPAELGALGLGCVACHDLHGLGGADASQPGLLRQVDVLAVLPGAPPAALGASRVCIPCHSPGNGSGAVSASAAAIWAGRGGVEPETGTALDGPAPHANDARGCLRCHDSGPPALERGKGHAFAPGLASCSPCHAEEPKRRPELAREARKLVAELLPRAREYGALPLHAEALSPALSTTKARALENALLVLEDPAADVHNPAYARRLLEAAGNHAKNGSATPSVEGAAP
jgi:hypothetical protein